MSTLPILPEVLHALSQAPAYMGMAVQTHEQILRWVAYNLTAVSPHNHWTQDGLQRLITNTPMSYDRWDALPPVRAHRLLDARGRSYVGDEHLAEVAVLAMAAVRGHVVRRKRRALKRAAARPAASPAMGYPMPYPYPQPSYHAPATGPRQPSEGGGVGVPLGAVLRALGAAGGAVGLLSGTVGAVGGAGIGMVTRANGAASAPATRTTKGAMSLHELKEAGWLTSNGWPVGTAYKRLVTINHETQCAHVMVSGSPGTGKSKTQLVPWTFSEIKLPKRLRASMVLMDPKPDAELTNTTIAVMERAGWRVWVYDPFSVGSMRLNVLGLCADAEEVEALIDAWVIGVIGVDHPTIGQPTKRVLTAVANHLRTEAGDNGARASLADVARFVKDDEDGDACLDLAGIKEKAKGITAMDGARDATRVLLNPNVAASMDGNDWDTAAFLAVPTIVYVPIAMGKRKASRPFFTTIFPMMFNEFTRASNGLPLKRRVRILADEFANMSPVKAFDDFISAVRYLNIGVAVASQGVSDIKVMYAGDWPRIEASLTTRLHLPRKGTAIISQEAAAPIIVTTHFWQRDPLMKLRVRLGKRRLTKALALARQLRQQQPLPTTAAATVEPPHVEDEDTEDTIEPTSAETEGQPTTNVAPSPPAGTHDTPLLMESPEVAPGDASVPVSIGEFRAARAAREATAMAEIAAPAGIDQADDTGDYSARNEFQSSPGTPAGCDADAQDAVATATGTEGAGTGADDVREVIRVLHAQGLSQRDIARRVGKSVGTVNARIKEMGL